MKIFKDNAVYVQKNDMVLLNHTDIPIPASIFMKVYGSGITIIDDRNRYEFIKFEDPSEVEFFLQQEWIVDYGEVKDMSEEQLLEYGQSIAEERNARATQFNGLPEDERRKQYESALAEMEFFDFKMQSVRDFIMFKRGELDFQLPNGVERPSIVIAEQNGDELTTVDTPTSKKESGIKKFFKSLRFGNQKQ